MWNRITIFGIEFILKWNETYFLGRFGCVYGSCPILHCGWFWPGGSAAKTKKIASPARLSLSLSLSLSNSGVLRHGLCTCCICLGKAQLRHWNWTWNKKIKEIKDPIIGTNWQFKIQTNIMYIFLINRKFWQVLKQTRHL